MNVKMRLVSASYSFREEPLTVELFGRTEDGRSVTALYYGFLPYFDVITPQQSELDGIRKNPEFVKMEKKSLLVNGEMRDAYRIYIKHPWKVPEIRDLFVSIVMAADIPFHHRFIYDLDLGACVEISGEVENSGRKYYTDIVVRAEKIETTKDFNPSIKVLSFDIENAFPENSSEQYGKILVIGYTIAEGKKITKGAIDGEEEILLENFVKLVKEQDPDVLIGYNVDGYDLPVVEYRMKRYGIRFSIGRDGSEPRRIQNQYWRLKGRIVSDVWWNVKRILRPKHETLNYVSHELLGEGKDDIDRLKIEEEWKNRKQEVIDYCIKDSYLTYLIMDKMRVLDRNMFMATVTKLPLEDTTNGGTSNYVDSILIRKADRENIGVPMTASQALKEKPIEGGHVESIGAGLYSRVIVLDFKSMYPSMIIKYNICFTTIDPDGTTISPSGVKFLDVKQKEGLVPRILKELMDERDKVKGMLKKSSGDEYEYYDGVQNALKILMNTFYGVLASSFYRFTNLEIGGSITAYARMTIMKLIERLKTEGFRVIYGDTDSVFIESGALSDEDAVKTGKELSSKISSELSVSIEFEKVMDPFFSHGAKKRYVGMIIYPESDKGKMLVRGYEVRRTDSFDLQSEVLETVFDFIMKRDKEGAREFSEKIVRRLLEGDRTLDIKKLVISRSVKDYEKYKDADSLANVRISKKLQEQGERFIPGMKVSWIVTDSSRTPQEVEPFIDGQEFLFEPDWAYYAKRIEETVNRVLESFDMALNLAGKVPKSKLKNSIHPSQNTLEGYFQN
ncbi:MAG: DNA-directed DNA polymerase [Thermoplasmataceae archaeon]